MAKAAIADRFWLLKTEPAVFSFDDLLKAPNQSTCWEGVRNYQARNFMRDGMKVGDLVFIYHSNAEPPGIAGIAEVAREAYPDPSQWQKASPYFDESAPKDGPVRWVMVDVKAKRALPQFLSLPRLKSEKSIQNMVLLQKGSRLSVQPVQKAEWKAICALAGVEGIG